MYQGGIHPRAAHSAVYISEVDSLYVFGGYDLNNILGDLVIFRFNSSTWYDQDDNVIGNKYICHITKCKHNMYLFLCVYICTLYYIKT